MGMNRGSYASWKRPQHLGISPKKYVKRQFEACWNLFGIQILLLELLTMYLRSSQTIGSICGLLHLFLPFCPIAVNCQNITGLECDACFV